MGVKELIVNAGSSSLKYTVFLMPEEKVLANGIFEQLTTPLPTFTHKLPNGDGKLVISEGEGERTIARSDVSKLKTVFFD